MWLVNMLPFCALIIFSARANNPKLNLNFELVLARCNSDVESTWRPKTCIYLTLKLPWLSDLLFRHLLKFRYHIFSFELRQVSFWNFATTQTFMNKNNLYVLKEKEFSILEIQVLHCVVNCCHFKNSTPDSHFVASVQLWKFWFFFSSFPFWSLF